jgi:hypothetical protein
MQIPFGPWLALALIAATAFALLHDLSMIAGRALAPWFGWMLP